MASGSRPIPALQAGWWDSCKSD